MEKSFITNDLNQLQSLEKEIVEVTSLIKKAIGSSENDDNHILQKDDIEKLENLINRISSKQNDQKKFLSDFQSFLKNRKIN